VRRERGREEEKRGKEDLTTKTFCAVAPPPTAWPIAQLISFSLCPLHASLGRNAVIVLAICTPVGMELEDARPMPLLLQRLELSPKVHGRRAQAVADHLLYLLLYLFLCFPRSLLSNTTSPETTNVSTLCVERLF